MKIFIAGASGFIGENLVAHCLDRGFEVVACVRDTARFKARFPAVQTVYGDYVKYQHYKNWLTQLEGVDVVINAVGIINGNGKQSFESIHDKGACALFRACKHADVKKIIQLSALGADASSSSKYHRTKYAADNYLIRLKIDWVIFQPSLVYGNNAKSINLLRALAALPITPLIDNGEQLVQPIHIDDLCNGVMTAIVDKSVKNVSIEAVGEKPITIKRLFEHLKRPFRFKQNTYIRVPYKVSLVFARVVSLFGNIPVNPGAIKMLQQGNIGNTAQFRKQIGFVPRDLEKSILNNPIGEADLLRAKLFFLIPALTWSIALVWILSGILSAFVYPQEKSIELLAQSGVPIFFAPSLLYLASCWDVLLGIAMLVKRTFVPAIYAQLSTIIVYSIIVAITLTEYMTHPFGPILKNLPIFIATLIVLKAR